MWGDFCSLRATLFPYRNQLPMVVSRFLLLSMLALVLLCGCDGENTISPGPYAGQGTHGITTIAFAVPFESQAKVTLQNLIGDEIMTIFEGQLDEGLNTFQWDTDTAEPGYYFVTIRAVDLYTGREPYVGSLLIKIE